MVKINNAQIAAVLLTAGLLGCACSPVTAAVRIEGKCKRVVVRSQSSTVTLWAASAGEPKQLAQTKTGNDGRFELGTAETLGMDVVLYLVAKGGEAADQ